ncbi:hypothetical protein PLESTB_000036900 [Pleodorina starrii]|uniref:Uncharacterized protein n=1 Tax=Pleodorina starrii TaxID=330485 RepID=A0A9W6B929_9CHLO|nr:hypothetical protein PLESTM_001096500 [Pleodorina starrii]GLC47891.1 hypothetical protein PLESTB_000036900 [Pleodorina starrii]GLC70678.1 hypothetical protein PLESTF_001020900 [Pleodorina starrii]
MESATEGAGGGGGSEGDSFVELLLQEVRGADLNCPSVQMLVEMAKSGDSDTVADALSYLVEAGVPDKAADCLRQIMAHARSATTQPGAAVHNGGDASPGQPPATGGDKPEPLDHALAARILNRIIELGSISEGQELVKFMLVARDTDRGRGKMLDCYDVSFILGSMVPENAADSAGRILFALYSSDSGEDSAASQTLVPFILGTLVDHNRWAWAVELSKQLMYTTLEEIEAGVGEYDYSVLGWCMAQMVWYGRADWAARICLELEREQLDWFSTQELLASVAGWGDNTYSMTIVNFMQDARSKEARRT